MSSLEISMQKDSIEKQTLKKRLLNYIIETVKEFAPAVIVMNGSYYRPNENK